MAGRLRAWLRFPTEPDIILAQYGELKRQVPLLYALLVVNAGAVTYTHWRFAPGWLTAGCSGVLVAVCGWRMLHWLFARDAGAIDVAAARRQLVRTTVLAGMLGAAFVCWSLLLDRYGGAIERGHVALFIAVTVIGCIVCLVNLPQAAILVTAAVTLPYLAYYLLQDEPVFVAMALNIALVTGVMVRVLLNSFDGFALLVRSRATIAVKQKEAERLGTENARLAHTDALTGLPNRRRFFAEFDRLLQHARARGGRLAVGVIDLDRFKPVNDSHGHVFGDRLLAEVGARLAELADGSTLLARLGGDEFGVLLTDRIDDARAIGQAICDRLAQPFVIEGRRIAIGCSAGFAIFPDAGATAHELFDRSDYALYHVKSSRRGQCALFSLEHETLIRSERAVEAALQAADLARELHVRFQPILCTQTLVVEAVEALGRWSSPTMGEVPPDRFIPAAERMGFIGAITTALFGKALADFAALPDGIDLSFNLSAHDIASPGTIDALVLAIARSGIAPRRITFELTETALLRDFDAAARGIGALRSLGAKVALDDFGTGYSSLGYLRRLPLDKVKVDRSFIADMDEASGRNIIAAILQLCRTLDLECVVEGVETEAQLALLRDLGYRQAQGYFFASPMSVRALLTWLARQRPAAADGPVRLVR